MLEIEWFMWCKRWYVTQMSARSSSKRSSRSGGKAAEPEGPFTADQIEEFKEAFGIFDKDGDGKVTLHEMEMLVNAVGYQPQEGEVDEICTRLDQTGTMKFTYDEFYKVAEHFHSQINMKEIITTCWRVFFSDSKTARADGIRDLLMQQGQPLTEGEVKQLLWNLDPDFPNVIDLASLTDLIVGTKDADD